MVSWQVAVITSFPSFTARDAPASFCLWLLSRAFAQAQDRSQLGNQDGYSPLCQAPSLILRQIRFQIYPVVGKFLVAVADYIGHNLPLQMGDSDDLRGMMIW